MLPSSRFCFWTFWLALFGVNLLGILQWLQVEFVIVDLAETMYHVKELSAGRIPYRDIFSHHFLGYLVPFWLVDAFLLRVGPSEVWSFALFFNFLNALFSFCILHVLGHRRAAYLAALLQATLGWFPGWAGFTFNNQSYFLPLLFLYYFFLLTACALRNASSLLAAGFTFGVLITFDQRLLVFALLFLIPFLQVSSWRCIAVVLKTTALAFSVPLFALLFLWTYGALEGFYQQTILYPLFHRNAGVGQGVFESGAKLLGKGLSGEGIYFFAALLALFFCVRYEPRAYLKRFFLLTFLCSSVYVFAGGRAYLNYWLIFTPWVVLLLALFDVYARVLFLRHPIAPALFLGLIAFFTALQPLFYYLEYGYLFFGAHDEISKKSAQYIREHASAEESILVWGYAPQIYLRTGKFSGFRDLGLISVAGANYGETRATEQAILPEAEAEFKAFLSHTPPSYFVFYQVRPLAEWPKDTAATQFKMIPTAPVQNNFDFRYADQLVYLREFLATRYQMVETFEGPYDRAEIFKLQ